MAKGYIYIMINPALQNMVKIGYAADVEKRRQQLSTTALPYEYEIYATYETFGKLEDKKLHKLIDNLNPDLRVSKNREFFIMTPEDAFELLEAIAIISDSADKLVLMDNKKKKGQKTTQQIRKPNINFFKCGLHVGDELVYINDSSIKVYVESEHKVTYENVITSLSKIVQDINGWKSAQGPSYFTYNGELLVELAKRTQWKDL